MNRTTRVARVSWIVLASFAALFMASCGGGDTPTPPVERVESIQTFTATGSNGGNVVGVHQYSINGASGALGSPVSAGFTNKDQHVSTDITVTGNGVIPRIYRGVDIYGTQSRTDVMSSNGRFDINNWNDYIGENETWAH